MKLFYAALLLVSSAFAASWDGTKGSITLKSEGDAQHTVISVTSTTTGPVMLVVTANIKKPAIGVQPFAKSQVRTLVRLDSSLGPAPGVLAIFDYSMDQISSVSVAEWKPGEAQVFGN